MGGMISHAPAAIALFYTKKQVTVSGKRPIFLLVIPSDLSFARWKPVLPADQPVLAAKRDKGAFKVILKDAFAFMGRIINRKARFVNEKFIAFYIPVQDIQCKTARKNDPVRNKQNKILYEKNSGNTYTVMLKYN